MEANVKSGTKGPWTLLAVVAPCVRFARSNRSFLLLSYVAVRPVGEI